jgi:6-phosphogluconolactonase (cycloisomerase 2 family)
VDQILTGKGPNSLALDPFSQRAFITNFLDNTIGIIDLDPSHARFHRMVLRIGTVRNLVR